jgi:hypothetical protein
MRLLFMAHEPSPAVELPDRKEITLREAITAAVYGKARTDIYELLKEPLVIHRGAEAPAGEEIAGDEERSTNKQRIILRHLLERLHEAAYAGRISFRGIKDGDDFADGHEKIDPLYFSVKRQLNWLRDTIGNPGPGSTPTDWHLVHIERESYVSLLEDMGISVKSGLDADVPGRRKTYAPGAQGRPTSKHLVLLEAQRRLNAGDYPETLVKFSGQLADWLKKTEPAAVPMTPKSIENNIRKIWHTQRPK